MPDRLRMLRQGRGDGFREALRAGADAVSEVLSCVLDDPRWDHQAEQRSEYYGRLLLALEADIGVLAARLLDDSLEDSSDVWLARGALIEMARRGHTPSRDAFVAGIRRGPWWQDCLESLWLHGGEALIRSVLCPQDMEALVSRVGGAALLDLATPFASPWWEAWAAEVPALRCLVEERARIVEESARDRSASEGEAPAPGESWSTTALLELAVSPDAVPREQRRIAVGILGDRGVADLLGEAERFLRSDAALGPPDTSERYQRRSLWLRYLRRLPAAVTLERARAWFHDPPPLSLAAEGILARHATLDDRVILEEAGSIALAEGDMYRLCSVIEALSTVGAAESLSLLVQVYSEVPYAYARKLVVRALVPHVRHEEARARAIEALWDCEEDAREAACAAATGDPGCTARLEELAEDAVEEPAVREAARRARADPFGDLDDFVRRRSGV